MGMEQKVVEGTKVPSRVAIVALGPTSLKYIQQCNQFGDRKLYDEVWTVNTYAGVIASDRLFHMDDFLVQERRAAAGNRRIANMLEAIRRYAGPVITCRPLERYPTSVEFPLGLVISKFNSCYFTNTVPYMLAYAGLLGVQEVVMFGCDYTWPDKVAVERGRACVEYWMGQLNAHGIATRVCDESTLMEAREYRNGVFPIYGYSDGHEVRLEPAGENRLRLVITEKELPSAEEVEKKYYHGVDTETPMEVEVADIPPV